jgi:hypothetical protein
MEQSESKMNQTAAKISIMKESSGGFSAAGLEHRFSPEAAEKRKQAAQLGFQGRDGNGLYDVSVK